MRIAIAAAVACLSTIGVTATAQVHAAARKHTEIPAEPLDLALRTLAKDRGFQVVYLTEDVLALQTRGAVGDFTVEEALRKLLSDSRLEYKFVDENTVSIFPRTIPISALEGQNGASASVRSDETSGSSPKHLPEKQFRLAQVDQGQTSGAAPVNQQDTQDSKEKPGLAEIVVTGTNIRGGTASASSIRTISRAEIDSTGVTSIEDLFKSAPENVGGMDVDTFRAGVPGQAGALNRGYASGVNLRGLGSDATLVLLNGQRLPIASSGYSVDISTIPLSAIDHVDILKDGASSIYGSDAVAGVVNIVTLQKFDGARTDITGGSVTDGNKRDIKIDQLLGTSWESGNIFGSYTFNSSGSLSADSRPATEAASQPQYAIPAVETNQIYLSLNQTISSAVDARLNILGSDRRIIAHDAGIFGGGTPDQEIYFDHTHIDNRSLVVNPTLTWAIKNDWRLLVNGQYSASSSKSANEVLPLPPVYPNTSVETKGSNHGGDVTADGPLFALPGGLVRLAVGASARSERYDGVDIAQLSRNIEAGYGELFVPIVGATNAAQGLQRLELTVSDRYDHYSDFGGTNNPKVGILFSPLPGLSLKGSYSTSFRAPLFSELGTAPGAGGNLVTPAPDAASPTGESLQLIRITGNPNLQPETARSYTAGLDYAPPGAEGVHLSIDYFSIDFKNRIEQPNSNNPFLALDPALYAPFITRNPTLAQITAITSASYPPTFGGPYNPADIAAIIDDRLQNADTVDVNGIDLNTKFAHRLGIGTLSYSLDATYLLKYDDTLLAGLAPIERLNTPYYPTKLRLRASAGWSSSTWSSILFANYVNSYTDNTNPTSIAHVGSWLTFDGQVSYGFPFHMGLLSDTRIALSVQNILNRQPPYVFNSFQSGGSSGDAGFNYDPVNASLLGRYISISLTTRL